jgi:hypothetical protein
MSALTSPDAGRVAANAATILFGVVAVLQLLIAAGVLPITMAWGGRQDTLTTGLRIASIASAAVLVLMAVLIRRRVGLMGGYPIPLTIKVLSWVATAYMAFNTLGNLTSSSKAEKILFTPITILLFLSCLLVSISKPEA